MYLVDRADADAVGAAHQRVFGGHPPAATMVVVAGLTVLLIAAAVVCRIKAPGPLSDREPTTAVSDALRLKGDSLRQ